MLKHIFLHSFTKCENVRIFFKKCKFLKSRKKMPIIENLNVKILAGVFGHITKAPERKVLESELNQTIMAQDKVTGDTYEVRVVTFQRLESNWIPEIFAFHSEGKPSKECTDLILKRSKVESINQLAYYVYQKV